MKRRFSKVTALLLSLALALSLALPALAFEDADPPLWQEWGYDSLEELLDYGWTMEDYEARVARRLAAQSWVAAHPDEAAAFDPYDYFAQYNSYYSGPQDCMEDWNITPEEFERVMLNFWSEEKAAAEETRRQVDEYLAAHPEKAGTFDVEEYFAREYSWYGSIEEYRADHELTREEFDHRMLAKWLEDQLAGDERLRVREQWAASHPEEYAAFDPYAYFTEEYSWYGSPEEYMEDMELSREEFELRMLDRWIRGHLDAEERQREIADFQAAYPGECAAFDPYAYFAEEYYYYDYDDPQEYMEGMGLTEEEFRQEMFLEWMDHFQFMAADKERLGGSATGINVMVNGQCVPFPDARPEIRNDRTMVPLAVIMERLGAQVSYDQASHTAQVSMDGLSFTHAIGTDALTLSDGSIVKMDVPSYIQDGRTMVPVRFFSEVLGYEVLWDQEYQTAVLLDRRQLAGRIDKDFTLLNRVLYAASGADQVREGQAVEQAVTYDLDLTLFDTLHGDQNIPVSLSGSALAGDKAVELHFSGDLSGLADFLESSEYPYLDSQVIAQLRPALAGFSADVILNLELGAVYFRCPALAGLGPEPVEPDAWMALPMDLSELSGLGLSLSGLSQTGTVGQVMAEISGISPFWLWNVALTDAAELKGYAGDRRFIQSGGSYNLSFEETDYGWSGEQTYVLKATVTPSGEKSCTYSLSFGLTGGNMVLDADLSGSSGKTDLSLSFHLKNNFKFTLEGSSRTSGSDQAPLSQPPAGSKIEFPAGPIGSGSL